MKKYSFVFFAILLGVLFWGQNRYAISTMDDDTYHFVFLDNGQRYYSVLRDGEERRPITSIDDVIESQSHFYMTSDGRVIVQGLAQLFCSITPFSLYLILNSMVFCLLVCFMVKESVGKQVNWLGWVVAFIAIWLIMRKGTFLNDIVCSCNYLWPAMANIFLFGIVNNLRMPDRKLGVVGIVLLSVVSFLVGSLHESFSLVFSAAYSIYFLFHRKQLNRELYFLLFAFFLGTAFCTFAPGNFIKATSEGAFSFSFAPLRRFFTIPSLLILLLSLVVMCFVKKSEVKNFLRQNIILFLASLFSLLLAFFVAYTGERQLTCADVCCTMLLIKFWSNRVSLPKRVSCIALPLLFVIMALHYQWIADSRQQLQDSYHEIMQDARSNKVLISYNYDKCRNDVQDNFFNKGFFTVTYPLFKDKISAIVTNGRDLHYIEKILPDNPESIAEKCKNPDNVIAHDVYALENGYYTYKSTEPLDLSKLSLGYKQNTMDPRYKNVVIKMPVKEYVQIADNYYYFFNEDNVSEIVGVEYDGSIRD